MADALTPTGRTEAFSDGVFAVAATLLVVEVVVPAAGRGELLGALAREWPAYATYAVSFLTIGIMWVNHHAIFDRLQRVDRRLQLLNLLLLMLVALVPFPTATLAHYLQAHHDERVAAALYGVVSSAMGLAFSALYGYAFRDDRFLGAGGHGAVLRRSFLRFGVGSLAYPAATALSLINAYLGLAIYAALAVYYALTPLPVPGPAAVKEVDSPGCGERKIRGA